MAIFLSKTHSLLNCFRVQSGVFIGPKEVVIAMVVIRLSRGGANKRPFYSMVVADSRSPRDGRYIEEVGFYNPIAKGGETPLRINMERIKYWESKGAQFSGRVAKLIEGYAEAATSEAK